MLVRNREAPHETAHSLYSMSILVLQNFKWDSEHWLACLIWIFLSSEWSVSFRLKIFKSYWSCQCPMQLHGARDSYLALSDLFVDRWVIITYSCQATKFWLPVAQKLSCWNHSCKWQNCQCDPLKQATQWQRWGLSWDLSFFNRACPEKFAILRLCHRICPI